MPTNHELFFDHLDRIFGEPSVIHRSEPIDGLPPVAVFVYKNIPEPGMITGVTYGLSLYPHPAWKLARPEMVVSVDSLDTAWPCAAGVFAADYRGKSRFCFGDVFTTDGPLAPDTKMDAFLIFALSILPQELQTVQMDHYKVHLSQFYPIYRSELPLYEKLGLERFFKHPQFDIYDVGRKPITAE